MQKPRRSVAIAVGILGEAYRQTVSEATIRAYEMGLSDLDDQAVERAVDRALRSCKFMSTVAELRELAGVLTPQKRAALAWEALRRAMRRVGEYKSISFDDPCITAAVRNLGGWVDLNGKGADELERFIRPRFEKVYAIFCESGMNASDAAPLVGLHEQHNRSQGFIERSNTHDRPLLFATGLPPHGRDLVRITGTSAQMPAGLLEGVVKSVD
jgi:hypothetical protein